MQRKERFTERSRNGNPVLDAVFLQAGKLPLRHADGNGVTITLCIRTAHTHSPPFVLLCNKCNRKILGCQENTPHILCSLVLASNFSVLIGCSRFVPCPVVQFGQLTQRFCVPPVLAGRFFAVCEGFQKFFGCRGKVHVFCSFLLQKRSASAIIIDRNRDCALGCAASVLWWNRSSVQLWSVVLMAYFLCHKG